MAPYLDLQEPVERSHILHEEGGVLGARKGC